MIPEILAPAGSMEALRAAVAAGADAVYLGGNRFGARAYADNFNQETLIEGIEYCHIYGVKVYLTINTLFRNEEINALYDYLLPYYQAGLDAVIVQDYGVVELVHRFFPDLPIHGSTQMTITTKYAYELFRDYGMTRIVPARELSIEEIRELKQVENPPEVEVFVQGALCYCYSGQCLMSSFLGGRSGNRGRCAQPCRLPYGVSEEDGRKLNCAGSYLLSPKDLCGLEQIPELIEAGVDSFKIEGRMKKPEYVAACVRAYRGIRDAWFAGTFSKPLVKKYKQEMAEVFNRGGFTEGYYHRHNGASMMSTNAPGHVGVLVGEISRVLGNQIEVRLIKDLGRGDILTINSLKDTITLTSNVDGRAGAFLRLNAPKTKMLSKNMQVFRMQKEDLTKELQNMCNREPTLPITGVVTLKTGEPAAFDIVMLHNNREYKVSVTGDIVEMAQSKPLTVDVVREKISSLGATRYELKQLDIHISPNAFYSLKALKELRRVGLLALEEQILSESRRKAVEVSRDRLQLEESIEKVENHSGTRVQISTKEQWDVVNGYGEQWDYYFDLQYFSKRDIIELVKGIPVSRVYIMLPGIVRAPYTKDVLDTIHWADNMGFGLVVRNIDELGMIKNGAYSGGIVADYNVYAMNNYAYAWLKRLVPGLVVTVSVELNNNEIEKHDVSLDRNEMIVYGYQPLMVSAQCLRETTEACNHNNEVCVLEDRYHKHFYARSICKYCYSIIYNSVPTVLFDQKLPSHFFRRLVFTREKEKDVRRVLDAYCSGTGYSEEKTKAHFNRGVE